MENKENEKEACSKLEWHKQKKKMSRELESQIREMKVWSACKKMKCAR